MADAYSSTDTGKGGDISKASGHQKAQPVVSLLEKYSSLHRGIEEARKDYSQRQREIEFIEGDILRIVDVDRIAMCEAVQNAIREKETLLKTLENLTMADLVEAQETESEAKSNRELVRFKEEKTVRVREVDQNQFLNASKVFREKIRTLSIRGELFGLKTQVTLLSVYKAIHSPDPSKIERTTNEANKTTTLHDENCDADDSDLLPIAMNLVGNYENDRTRKSNGKNKIVDPENDEEVQDLLEQIRTLNEFNKKQETIMNEKKQKLQPLLDVKEKRHKQKKDLKSQFERLEKDTRDVVFQIENLNQQTKEAIELTTRFRTDVENQKQFETSGSSTAQSSKSTTSRQLRPQGGGHGVDYTAINHSTISSRKSTTTYNPYARVKRRKPVSETSNTTRMISPVVATASASPKTPRVNETSRFDKTREVSNRIGDRDNHQSISSRADEYHLTTTASTVQHRQHSIRSKRVSSSRHFGESCFRTPSASLMRDSVGDGDDRQKPSTTTGNTARSMSKKRGKKRSRLSMLHDDEDTDDEDDISWLNASPFLSKSSRHPN